MEEIISYLLLIIGCVLGAILSIFYDCFERICGSGWGIVGAILFLVAIIYGTVLFRRLKQ